MTKKENFLKKTKKKTKNKKTDIREKEESQIKTWQSEEEPEVNLRCPSEKRCHDWWTVGTSQITGQSEGRTFHNLSEAATP